MGKVDRWIEVFSYSQITSSGCIRWARLRCWQRFFHIFSFTSELKMLKEIKKIAHSVKKSLSQEMLQLQALLLERTFTVWSRSVQGETWMEAHFTVFIYSVLFTSSEERTLNWVDINWAGLAQYRSWWVCVVFNVGRGWKSQVYFSFESSLPLALCRCPEKHYCRGRNRLRSHFLMFFKT